MVSLGNTFPLKHFILCENFSFQFTGVKLLLSEISPLFSLVLWKVIETTNASGMAKFSRDMMRMITNYSHLFPSSLFAGKSPTPVQLIAFVISLAVTSAMWIFPISWAELMVVLPFAIVICFLFVLNKHQNTPVYSKDKVSPVHCLYCTYPLYERISSFKNLENKKQGLAACKRG